MCLSSNQMKEVYSPSKQVLPMYVPRLAVCTHAFKSCRSIGGREVGDEKVTYANKQICAPSIDTGARKRHFDLYENNLNAMSCCQIEQ